MWGTYSVNLIRQKPKQSEHLRLGVMCGLLRLRLEYGILRRLVSEEILPYLA